MGSYYMSSSAALETSSSTYKVYCVLSKYANYQTRECFVSKKTIASEAKVSLSTVFRALKELCAHGLISIVTRFSGKRQTSNLYKLLDNPQLSMEEAPKPDKKVRGFSSSTKALTASVSATAYRIYDYFQLRAGAQQSFHESKRTIAAQCGVSVSTVSRVLRELRDAGLITIHSQSRKDDNGAAENLYFLHSTPRRQRASKWKLLLAALLLSLMSQFMTRSCYRKKSVLCKDDNWKAYEKIKELVCNWKRIRDKHTGNLWKYRKDNNIMEKYYISNSVALEMSASAYKVYCVLSKYANQKTRKCVISLNKLVADTKKSRSTVNRALKELSSHNLISVSPHFCNGRQTANLYTLLDDPKSYSEKKPKTSKKMRRFFSRTKALEMDISEVALRIYDYFYFRAGVGRAFRESKKEIAKNCGVSVSTVSRVLRELRDTGLIEICSQTRETDNAAIENLYLIRDI